MEASSLVSFSSPKPLLHSHSALSRASPSRHALFVKFQPTSPRGLALASSPPSSHPLLPPRAVAEADAVAPRRGAPNKVDKSGRFCSPRAARELALLIAYAACLEGSDPVRLFDRIINAKREPGYVFDKTKLLQYDHMSFSGAPVEVQSDEEAEELMLMIDNESSNEAEVLSAPLKLVYNKFVLSLTRDLLRAVVNRWNEHVCFIDKIIPQNWKNEPAARILELCILHLAMAEIKVIGTRQQIVINEAVDLAKRFCDGCAPRIVNGCLRTFCQGLENK